VTRQRKKKSCTISGSENQWEKKRKRKGKKKKACLDENSDEEVHLQRENMAPEKQ